MAEYLDSNTIEFFLPTYRTSRRWKNGCRVELELPLFAGYLFVRIPLVERLDVQRCPSVVRIVGFADRPFPLDDAEIRGLQSGLSQCAAEPYPYFATGDRIRVRNGPFAGMEGVLVRKKKDFRVVLSINILAKSIAVELDLCDLEPTASRRFAADSAAILRAV